MEGWRVVLVPLLQRLEAKHAESEAAWAARRRRRRRDAGEDSEDDEVAAASAASARRFYMIAEGTRALTERQDRATPDC